VILRVLVLLLINYRIISQKVHEWFLQTIKFLLIRVLNDLVHKLPHLCKVRIIQKDRYFLLVGNLLLNQYIELWCSD